MMLRRSALLARQAIEGSRPFSVGLNIGDKFQKAWEEGQFATTKKATPQPKDRKYSEAYYQQNLRHLKKGYTHPYHDDKHPIHFSIMHHMSTLWEAVGPEQVSPHYETLSRSRRGLIFMFAYIGSIVTISRMCGWANNEWLRGLIWHHEYLLAFYLGFIETRHFTQMLGPKFSVFYNVFTAYEVQQFALQWADACEAAQEAHLAHTKQQLEYNNIHEEYGFIKKRSLANFLINERINADRHITERALGMLKNIKTMEKNNLTKQLHGIAFGSLEVVEQALKGPEKDTILRQSFEAALIGIRSGKMTYENDPLFPILNEEVQRRSKSFKSLTPQEESDLLKLTPEQRKVVQDLDRKTKNDYLVFKD